MLKKRILLFSISHLPFPIQAGIFQRPDIQAGIFQRPDIQAGIFSGLTPRRKP